LEAMNSAIPSRPRVVASAMTDAPARRRAT
jgi:hypothetical protein